MRDLVRLRVAVVPSTCHLVATVGRIASTAASRVLSCAHGDGNEPGMQKDTEEDDDRCDNEVDPR